MNSQSSLSPNRNTLPYKPHYADTDSDPYAPTIVQDLLHGSQQEWKNIQDIVKMTFRALTDVVRSQGLAIREMERIMPTKANKVELNTGLSLKANVSDVSRTVAEINSALDVKSTYDEVQGMLDEKVTKSDLQYILSNKVSIEELQRIMDNKANSHEINMEVSQLQARVDDTFQELSKRVSQCALSQDMSYFHSLLETKANIEEVNESLSNKASKTSVANALHRKANRTDIDELLALKVDCLDLEKVVAALEQKADIDAVDAVRREIGTKVDRQDMHQMQTILKGKAEKQDVDVYVMAVSSQRHEWVEEVKRMERELDECCKVVQKEVEQVKGQMLQGLNKKADYSLVDNLKDSCSKKVDYDYFQSVISKTKQEMSTHMSTMHTDIQNAAKHRTEFTDDRMQKLEIQCDRALDEAYYIKDQHKRGQEDRKKETDETSASIKKQLNSVRDDVQAQLIKFSADVDRVRKEVTERVTVTELLDTKSKIYTAIEEKPTLKEVQTALNDCQNDICEQLSDFRKTVKSEIAALEEDLQKILDRKANVLEVEDQLNKKVDSKELSALVTRTEMEVVKEKMERCLHDMVTKLDSRGKVYSQPVEFEDFDDNMRRRFDEHQALILQKSNIKDVCALLDMKSNIDDVNKALNEIHEEQESRVVQREFQQALLEQNAINEVLCQENCVGRWLWKSGDLKGGFAVPWEIQSVNTCPENFLWEEEKQTILTVAPGMYEITFGFFASKKPTVQLMVNGEAVLSAVNNSSYVIHHSSGKLKTAKSPGNIGGMTLLDFINLPARARISISYTGEATGDGFMSLRKL